MQPNLRFFVMASLTLAFVTLLPADIEAQTSKSTWMRPYITYMLQEQEDILCLGWSKDGICALLEQQGTGARGGFCLRFVAINSVEDNVLFDKKVYSDELGGPSDDPAEAGRLVGATENAIEFARLCDDLGIGESGAPVAGRFPLAHRGSQVNVSMLTKPSSQPLSASEREDTGRGAQKLDFQIVASRSGKGSKTLSRLAGVMASDFAVGGYFLSPYEARILVFYTISTPGFEGDRNTTMNYAGCNLEVGFK